MEKKLNERLSKEQLDEKQHLVTDLSNKLLEAFVGSEVFKAGKDNELIFLDVMMGIGLFTARVLYAAEKATHADGGLINFYKEQALPSAISMYNELSEDQDEERLKFS